MTPKEKAKELVEKYLPLVDCGDNIYTTKVQKENAKQCALMAVDEIIDAIDWHEYEVPNDQLKFWFEVKHEIEKL